LKGEQVLLSPYDEARTGAGFPLAALRETVERVGQGGRNNSIAPIYAAQRLSLRVINV
jgi:hypothetical protein